MKIIHCADIHLGSKMSTHFNFSQAKERQNELLSTFGKMVNFAKQENVKIIIIAGDLLDNSGNIRECDYIISTITANPEIQFMYLAGNHDEDSLLLQMQNLPKNLHTFGNKWRSYCFDNITISGIEPGKNTTYYNDLLLDKDKINIVVLHGQEIKGQKKDGEVINLDALKNKNIDYLALGHLHSFKQAQLDNRGTYCYSGCLEGRGFDECGEKGFVLLDIDDKVNIEFIPFASREFVELNVDISNLICYNEIKQKIKQTINGMPKNNIMRVNLVGTYTLETQKYVDNLANDFNLDYYYLQIVDKTTLKINDIDYSKEVSLAGEFVRLVQSSDLAQEQKEQIILYGLKAINDKGV